MHSTYAYLLLAKETFLVVISGNTYIPSLAAVQSPNYQFPTQGPGNPPAPSLGLSGSGLGIFPVPDQFHLFPPH